MTWVCLFKICAFVWLGLFVAVLLLRGGKV